MKLSVKAVLAELKPIKLNRRDGVTLVDILDARLFPSKHALKGLFNALRYTKVLDVELDISTYDTITLTFGTSTYTLNTIPTGEYNYD